MTDFSQIDLKPLISGLLGINFPIHSLGVMPMSNKVDLPPVLSVLAFFCEGTSKLTRTNRLDLKESDRIVAIDKLIKNLGGKIRWGRNFIKIKGGQILKDGVVDSFNYHRIAMAASIASIFCNKAIILNGAENVFKSYPKFFSDFKKLLF